MPVRDRLALRRAAVRLGRPRDLGARARAARRAAYVAYYPDLAVPGAAEPSARSPRARCAAGVAAARAALRPRRGGGRARRGGARRRRAPRRPSSAASWFMQNFSEGYFASRSLAGELALPAGDVPEPFVDAEDIADVAVAALTEDGHAGRALRADRAAAADLRRGGRRDRPRPPAATSRYVPIPIDAFAAAAGGGRTCRDDVDRAAALPVQRGARRPQRRSSPTACSGRSAARRATSRLRPPRGRRGRLEPLDRGLNTRPPVRALRSEPGQHAGRFRPGAEE